ncbi:MAG: TadE/TadG family type IV pilus assembly protein [Pseudomonadota bacterium]
MFALKSRPRVHRPRLALRGPKAFLQDTRGLSAIEFAFVAGPFFLLLIGIFEICIIFVISTVLDFGAHEAARDIRTGAFQSTASGVISTDRQQFLDNTCDRMANLFNCDVRLDVALREVTAFPTVNFAVPTNMDGSFDDSALPWELGDREDIMVVTVYFQWTLITPLISKPMSNMPNDTRLLVSTQAFRNEPF